MPEFAQGSPSWQRAVFSTSDSQPIDDNLLDILRRVAKERGRQDKKHGDQNKNDLPMWMVVLMEEVGEVARNIYEYETCQPHSRTLRLRAAKKELIEVAAVAVAMVEAIEEGRAAIVSADAPKTEAGKNLKTLLETPVSLEPSSRGFGDVTPIGEGCSAGHCVCGGCV